MIVMPAYVTHGAGIEEGVWSLGPDNQKNVQQEVWWWSVSVACLDVNKASQEQNVHIRLIVWRQQYALLLGKTLDFSAKAITGLSFVYSMEAESIQFISFFL